MTREEAKEILRGMTLQEMIDLWNEDCRLHGMHLSTVHPMGELEWWNELFRRNIDFCWNMVNHLLGSGETFNLTDKWFFWDEDTGCFCSFSTKQEWLESITDEDYFVTAIINKHE